MKFEMAQQVANAVLYEGYLLYPYRASATKNQLRWQFGVVMPRDYSENGAGEPWVTQTECLVEPGDRPESRSAPEVSPDSGEKRRTDGARNVRWIRPCRQARSGRPGTIRVG